ncbi:MAG TPA: universal stress protein [Alcanivoracaceae bacterium]|nr:universal stress protein [Alcanivoracaceae bacterium]
MTDTYQTLLVAIDGSDDSALVLQRALSVAHGQGERLHVLHVIEPLALAYGADVPIDVTDLQNNLIDQARDRINKMIAELPIPAEQVYVELGAIEKTIHVKVEELNADVVVMGSHMRGGWGMLLGSTARGVLPGSKCDVLAVKVGNK